MRSILAAALVLALLAPHTVHAQGPGAPNDVFAIRLGNGEVALVWTPVPQATHYIVYRGSSALDLEPVASVATPYFIDTHPAPGVVWYGVAAANNDQTSEPHNTNTGQDGDACVTHNGGKVSVNAQGCVGNRG